jgi:transcriptional regulator with XRE-family HTH domain
LRQLRAAREAAGLTQTQLAERRQLQGAQRFESRCETGDRRVDVAELWVLCRALGVPFDELTRALDAAFLDEFSSEQ